MMRVANRLCVFLVIACLMIEISFQLPPEPYTDWMRDHYKVYAVKTGKTRTPERTLQLLRRLQKRYEGRDDTGSVGRSEKVNALIEASEMGDDNCDEASFERLKQLKDRHNFYDVSLVPYLDHHETRLKRLCFAKLY